MALHVLDEANRCLGCKKPMCQQGCPIHTNIPEVIRLLKDNHLDDAGRMLFENNPLTLCAASCATTRTSARATASATGCPATTPSTSPSSRTTSPPPTPTR